MTEKEYTLDEAYVEYSASSNKRDALYCLEGDPMKKSVHMPAVSGVCEPIKAKPTKKKKKGTTVEITEEMKKDLEVLKMRSALDPKRFYKRNSSNISLEQVQVGRVVDSSADFYSSRIPKKLRKKTIVDELLADSEFQRYNKRRFVSIIEQKSNKQKRAYNFAKRLKKKNKR